MYGIYFSLCLLVEWLLFIKVNSANGKDMGAKVKKGTWCVLWWAKWCPHCVMFHPSWMEAVKSAKVKEISILEVEYDVSGTHATKYA